MIKLEIQKFIYENVELFQIYITEQEEKNKGVLEKINQLKGKQSNVTVFVSGEKNPINTIQEILNYEKAKNII